MKQFTITKIQTDKDGHIVLSGKKGMIQIRRSNDYRSNASYHPNINGRADSGSGIHTLEIREIPLPRAGKELSTSIVF